jgi:hypothetical protein
MRRDGCRGRQGGIRPVRAPGPVPRGAGAALTAVWGGCWWWVVGRVAGDPQAGAAWLDAGVAGPGGRVRRRCLDLDLLGQPGLHRVAGARCHGRGPGAPGSPVSGLSAGPGQGWASAGGLVWRPAWAGSGLGARVPLRPAGQEASPLAWRGERREPPASRGLRWSWQPSGPGGPARWAAARASGRQPGEPEPQGEPAGQVPGRTLAGPGILRSAWPCAGRGSPGWGVPVRRGRPLRRGPRERLHCFGSDRGCGWLRHR